MGLHNQNTYHKLRESKNFQRRSVKVRTWKMGGVSQEREYMKEMEREEKC